MADPFAPVASTSSATSTPPASIHSSPPTPPPASPLPSLLRLGKGSGVDARGRRVSTSRLSTASVSLGVDQKDFEGPPVLRRERSVVFEPRREPGGSEGVVPPVPPLPVPAPVEAEAAATTTPRVSSPASGEDGAAYDSDGSSASSGFTNLLSRVVGATIDPPSLLGVPPPASLGRSFKGKGKAKEEKDEDEPALLAELAEGDEHDEADDDEGELVQREEGQADPRDMLREQLRKNEEKDRGKGSWRATHSPVTDHASDHLELTSRYSPRRYFILSTAGKLVFTTDPDEEEATGYVGVMQAIISIFADEGDRLRYVDAGTTKIAFLLKPPLYLVCVSDWGEPESVLRTHLDYLYLQVLSVVTLSQLTAIFARRSNFDLRRLLEGTEGFFKNLTTTLQTSLPILTSCLEVYRIDPTIRDEVAKALSPGRKIDDLLYALVLSSSLVVTLVRPKKHSVHPSDLHLLLSTIASSSTFQTPEAESWIPICLPRFNSKGFLHAYISYLDDDTGLVFVCGEREGFEKMQELAREVKGRLAVKGLLGKVKKEKGSQRYSLGELSIPGLRHFLYKSRAYVQVTSPAYEGDYVEDENKFRLVTLYQRLHDALHIRRASLGSARPAAKLVYLRTEHESLLGWTTSTFELYVALSPLLPKTAVVSAARAVSRWVKAQESRLFLTSAPSF